jgi:predicted P-loop ATPase
LIVKGKDIPLRVDIRASLDITMPQDERQSVQTATQATSGDRPLMSLRAARERFLNIGQSDDMTKETWEEKLSEIQLQMQFQQQMQALQGQGQPQPGQTQTPMPQQGQPTDSVPPELLQQMQQQGAQPGLPLTEPMQPQGQPPEGMPV